MTLPEDTAAANGACAAALVRALVSAHARRGPGPLQVVASPGSRSTPLLLALAAHPGVALRAVLDERAAAFVALGLAQASGRLAVTLCTSGSAAAHALPAAIEAHHAGVPLVLLTADRPAEAQGVGAAQTTPQGQLYAAHARLTLQLPEPLAANGPTSASAAAARAVLGAWQTAGVRAVVASSGTWPGPVHLNLPFREPLGSHALPAEAVAAALPRPPPTAVWDEGAAPGAEAVAALAAFCRGPGPGLVLCGAALPAAADPAPLAAAVHRLASRLGWPVVAEGASGLGAVPPQDGAPTCPPAQPWLASPGLPRPRRLLRLGAAPMGRQTMGLATAPELEACCVVAPAGTWPDPAHRADLVLQADAGALLAAVATAELPAADAAQRQFAATWALAARTAEARCAGWSAAAPGAAGPSAGPWFEGSALRAVLGALPGDAQLVLGNSLTVRDLDDFGGTLASALRVHGRRGVSGIDGALAHLMGIGLASPGRPSVALLGDLTFAYDVGSLAACAASRAPLVVVVFDNGGGEIFAQLPIASNAVAFEPYFRTPQALDVAALCAAYGVGHVRVHAAAPLGAAVRRACSESLRSGLQVVEVHFDVTEARRARQGAKAQLVEAVAAALLSAAASLNPR